MNEKGSYLLAVQAKEENKSLNRAASHINFAGLSENENMLLKRKLHVQNKKESRLSLSQTKGGFIKDEYCS